MISVIIPVYNMGTYLGECLDSVISQSYKDFEVLLVDDGSIDNSLAICQKWAERDGRFRVFSQGNAGVSVARNRALQEAKGEYVCFVDADDVITTDYLAHLLDLSKDECFPICGYSREKASLGTGGDSIQRYDAKKFIVHVVEESIDHPNLWMMLFKRDIIDEHGIRFTPGCVRNEDTEFYIQYLLYEQTVVVSNFRAYYYRPNPTSAMGAPETVKALTSIEAAERINKMLYDQGVISDNKIVLSNSVLTYAFSLSKRRNAELYNYLHDHYDVRAAMKKMCAFPRMAKRLVAFTYLLLGRRIFYASVGIMGRYS